MEEQARSKKHPPKYIAVHSQTQAPKDQVISSEPLSAALTRSFMKTLSSASSGGRRHPDSRADEKRTGVKK